MTFIDKSSNEMTYQPSKRGHFYHQASTKSFIGTIKGLQGLSYLTISTTHHTYFRLSKNRCITYSVCKHVREYSNQFVIFSTNLCIINITTGHYYEIILSMQKKFLLTVNHLRPQDLTVNCQSCPSPIQRHYYYGGEGEC